MSLSLRHSQSGPRMAPASLPAEIKDVVEGKNESTLSHKHMGCTNQLNPIEREKQRTTVHHSREQEPANIQAEQGGQQPIRTSHVHQRKVLFFPNPLHTSRPLTMERIIYSTLLQKYISSYHMCMAFFYLFLLLLNSHEGCFFQDY